MTRHIAAIVILLCLNGSSLAAQIAGSDGVELTVNLASANVHKFPSIASPVIGKAQRGNVLVINRHLGSWVEVAMAEGEGGVAFLHVNAGSISGRMPVDPNRVVAPPVRPTSTPASSIVSATTAAEQMTRPRSTSTSALHRAAKSPHRTGRTHDSDRAGLWCDVQGMVGQSRWRSIRGVTPSPRRDRFAGTDDVHAIRTKRAVLAAKRRDRQFVAASIRGWRRQLQSGERERTGLPAPTGSSDTSMGYQAFGGAETTLAGLPQFSLSADAGYRRTRSTFAGFDKDRIAIAISGHWYVK